MIEIIDALAEGAIEQSVAMDLPDEDTLVEIEETILLHIPYEFKQYLLQASHFVYGSLEPVTASDPNLHTHLPDVIAEAWSNGIPRDLIPICQTGDDYYLVNQDGEVQLWQDGELGEDYWESVWRWIQDVWLNS